MSCFVSGMQHPFIVNMEVPGCVNLQSLCSEILPNNLAPTAMGTLCHVTSHVIPGTFLPFCSCNEADNSSTGIEVLTPIK